MEIALSGLLFYNLDINQSGGMDSDASDTGESQTDTRPIVYGIGENPAEENNMSLDLSSLDPRELVERGLVRPHHNASATTTTPTTSCIPGGDWGSCESQRLRSRDPDLWWRAFWGLGPAGEDSDDDPPPQWWNLLPDGDSDTADASPSPAGDSDDVPPGDLRPLSAFWPSPAGDSDDDFLPPSRPVSPAADASIPSAFRPASIPSAFRPIEPSPLPFAATERPIEPFAATERRAGAVLRPIEPSPVAATGRPVLRPTALRRVLTERRLPQRVRDLRAAGDDPRPRRERHRATILLADQLRARAEQRARAERRARRSAFHRPVRRPVRWAWWGDTGREETKESDRPPTLPQYRSAAATAAIFNHDDETKTPEARPAFPWQMSPVRWSPVRPSEEEVKEADDEDEDPDVYNNWTDEGY